MGNIIQLNNGNKKAESTSGISYTFGEVVEKTSTRVDKDGNETTKVEIIGYDITPLSIVEDVEADKLYVRYKYVTGTGIERFGHYDLGAIGDGNAKRKEVSLMRQRGARVIDMPKPAIADALQAWADTHDNATMRQHLASQPGFFTYHGKRVYIAAHNVVLGEGAESWTTDPESSALDARSSSKGSFEDWKQAVERNVVTPGTLVSLGTSLASPVTTLLGVPGFGLHFVGMSSSGKSSALKVGASVWGNPDIVDASSVVRSWNNTITEVDNIARMMHGACVCMDELGTYRGFPGTLGEIVYNMIGGQTRGRANKDGSSQTRRGWRVNVLSTGEISFKEKVGAGHKGGQAVRMADVAVEIGSMTKDAAHADEIHTDFCNDGSYGTAGIEWVKFLLEDAAALDMIQKYRSVCREHLHQYRNGNAEVGRMLDSYELIGASLLTFNEGLADGVMTDEGSVLSALGWLVESVIEERGEEKDPHSRDYAVWQTAMESEPGKFPLFSATAGGQVWGYVKDDHGMNPDTLGQERERWVYTTENLLKASKVISGSPRRFLSECIERGQAESVDDGKQVRIDGRRGRFVRFKV